MDEPTASLDYGNLFRLLRQVRALADSGYTVLLSTHNPEHAFRFATHALVLQDGGVRARGPVKETQTEELLRDMAASTIKMVTESVDAYVKHDILLAEKVVGDDDTVDHYFDQVKNRLIEKIAQDPGDGEYALDLLMIAKYLERIGDHAVNIAQWVIFSVTGTHKED